jgi:hypothetical protein
MEFQVDALTSRPPDTDAATTRWNTRVRKSAPPESRSEIRCSNCGFGAIVAHPLGQCPMCACGDWQPVEARSASAGAEVWRS